MTTTKESKRIKRTEFARAVLSPFDLYDASTSECWTDFVFDVQFSPISFVSSWLFGCVEIVLMTSERHNLVLNTYEQNHSEAS